MQEERIDLHCTAGGSDKVYHAQLTPAGSDGWRVDCKYGRRGGTLKLESKTPQPVPYETAKKVFDKLVKEKLAKAYVRLDGDGTRVETALSRAQQTGIVPQLLNFVTTEAELQELIENPDYVAQPKFDGERRPVRVGAGGAMGSNRMGLEVVMPAALAEALALVEPGTVLDGEAVGDVYYAFDILEHKNQDVRGKPLQDRLALLDGALAQARKAHPGRLPQVETSVTKAQKRATCEALGAARAEGIVFKRKDAPYEAGRPASGGAWLKYKFYKTATVQVAARVTGKRSVEMQVFDQGKPVAVGKVTVKANQAVPEVGDILEVKYLYAYPGGSLFQPEFLFARKDVDVSACGIGQLVYKQGTAEDDT